MKVIFVLVLTSFSCKMELYREFHRLFYAKPNRMVYEYHNPNRRNDHGLRRILCQCKMQDKAPNQEWYGGKNFQWPLDSQRKMPGLRNDRYPLRLTTVKTSRMPPIGSFPMRGMHLLIRFMFGLEGGYLFLSIIFVSS